MVERHKVSSVMSQVLQRKSTSPEAKDRNLGAYNLEYKVPAPIRKIKESDES
jgi:hypothetical protein